MTRESPPASLYLVLSTLLLAIVVSGVVDLMLDDLETVFSLHVLNEALMIALSMSTAIYLGVNWHRARRSLASAQLALEQRQQERDLWRSRAQKFLQGLGEEIDAQLKQWGLTPTERQTALFLLKGLSLKEIAQLNERSERTVRQHAIAVYRKSGLKGRAELSAFFLEDLLLPQELSDDVGAE